ncbi:hypothetical protein [Phenylobacterium sp.]|uniref:hypothetical protein n=1 Tax=Phenylobacterium sp. TaxID=1871053 RepID=UPI002EDAA03F
MIALLLAAMFQSTAPVSSFVAPTPTKAVSAKPDKDGIVCRKEAVLGSRMKTKVCERPSQTQQRSIDDRDLIEKAQVLQTIRDPAAGPPP